MDRIRKRKRLYLVPILLMVILVALGLLIYRTPTTQPVEEPAEISFRDIQKPERSPKVYEPVEFNIYLAGKIKDFFDENEVNVTSEVTLPNGEKWRGQAFIYQMYNRSLSGGVEVLTPVGEPFWKLRLTPLFEGTHVVNISLYSKGKLIDSRIVSINVEGYSQNPGFARIGGNYLVRDDGSELFLIGQNVCWYTASKKTYDYDDWFEKMAENGMNYARIWMAPWAFGIEWKDKVGRYDLKEAWRLDYVLQLAEEKGIYIMLCLVNHGQLRRSDDWSGNPYNRARGGPLSSPEQFFTDPVAKDYFKKRLRYLVSRYAYNTHLLAWEFFNEVDLTDGYNPSNVASWHREMAEYLSSIDPYDHLITTSFSDPRGGDLIWKTSGLDFTQTHMYGPGIKDLGKAISAEIKRKLSLYGKPTLFGEFGADWRWFDSPLYYRDRDGVEIHEGIWASCMSGSFGTAMTWWWDVYVDPFNLYYRYKALKKFLTNISFNKSGFRELEYKLVENEKIKNNNTNFEIIGLQNETFAMGWIRNKDYNWFNAINNFTLKTVGGVDLEFKFNAGSYLFEVWNTYTGERTWSMEVESSDGRIIVEIPTFLNDISFKMIRVEK